MLKHLKPCLTYSLTNMKHMDQVFLGFFVAFFLFIIRERKSSIYCRGFHKIQ